MRDGDTGKFVSADIEADEIRRLYWDERMTLEEVGDEIGVSTTTVRRAAKRNDIPIRSKGATGERNPNYEGGPVEINCEWCGEQFEVRPSISDDRRHCSKECQMANRDFNGEKNPAWKGGVIGPDWEKKRAEAIERDGRECVDCGDPEPDDGSLDVHHITPRKEFRERDDLDETNMNNLDNLVTLCRKCHIKREREEDNPTQLEVEE